MAALLLAASVIVGGALVLVVRQQLKATLQGMLVFSGAFLLGVSALHLIPEVYEIAPYPGVFLLVGFLVQITAESLSKGVEHGHHHAHGKHAFPITILFGLFLHTYIEAVPLGGLDENTKQHTTVVQDPNGMKSKLANRHSDAHHDHSDTHHDDGDAHQHETHEQDNHGHNHAHSHSIGESFLLSVLAHKVPMAFALMALMLQAGTSTKKRWLWLLVFAASGPLGIATGSLITDQEVLFALLAVALGSFLHVSTTIILESESGHRFSIRHIMLVLTGFGLAWLVSG
jgi:zinc transporter ZupT